MTDFTLAQEYANNIEGLKDQILIIVSFVISFFSIGLVLFAVGKKNISKALVGTMMVMVSMFLFVDATSVPCGCDFNEDPGGCSAACAYDWDDKFFTMKYAKGAWDGYQKGITLP